MSRGVKDFLIGFAIVTVVGLIYQMIGFSDRAFGPALVVALVMGLVLGALFAGSLALLRRRRTRSS